MIGKVASGRRAVWMWWPAVLAALWIVPAQALVPALPDAAPATEATPDAPAITADRADGDDPRIARRIQEIFAEVPSLTGVQANVQGGVVSLTGKVADAAARDRAEAIASRVEGVVTVENAVERDVSVDGSRAIDTLAARANGLVRMLPLAGVALVVALLIGGLGHAVGGLGLWHRMTRNIFLAELIGSAIRFVAIVGGVVIALDMLGAGTLLGAVLGGAGVVGIALGFAMRDTIENYVASLMLSLRQPFRANDWVVIDDREGRVIRLTSRATILMTLDGNHLRIPNSQVFKAVILNYTTNPQRRFEFDLGIDAGDDPTAARHLGVEVLAGLPFVLDTPEPQARVMEVGDSNIVIRFLGWVDQREADWFKARSRAIPAVKDALESSGFALPEPIYRVRLDGQMPAVLDAAATEAEPSRPPVRKPAVMVSHSTDTSPETEVAQMVEQERRVTGERDLLDAGRPPE